MYGPARTVTLLYLDLMASEEQEKVQAIDLTGDCAGYVDWQRK